MSSTEIVGLDLRVGEQLPIADLIRRAGQVRAIRDFAADLERHAKAELEQAAREDVDTAGGGGFSRTVEGVRAILSDPQPRPYIADEGEFVTWLLEHTDLEVQTVERVEVIDHDAATFALSGILGADAEEGDPALPDPEADWHNLATGLALALRHHTEYRLPERVLDTLIESGRTIVTSAGLADPATGETVPGVACQQAKATLSVTPSKQAKARDRAIVASFFNLPSELPGGGA